jgi:hypothetical protein
MVIGKGIKLYFDEGNGRQTNEPSRRELDRETPNRTDAVCGQSTKYYVGLGRFYCHADWPACMKFHTADDKQFEFLFSTG